MQSRVQRKIFLALLALVTALAACHDSNGKNAVAFDPFVTNLIQNGTSESTTPVEVAGTRFAFLENPAAFDAVLSADNGPVVEQ